MEILLLALLPVLFLIASAIVTTKAVSRGAKRKKSVILQILSFAMVLVACAAFPLIAGATGETDAAATAAATPAPAPAEPTKGVQTYIPMSQYRRLNDIKLTRRENIADLAAQAINLWLDVQEGKLVVTKPE